MANKEKGFNTKLYAVVTFVVIAAILAVTCVTTFKSRYTAFHPEEVARNYVDTIVQTGDGYNAYKNTIVSKSSKYGDFIRKYYIYPAIYRDTDYKIGDSTSDFTGYNDDKYIGEKTLNDDGTLTGRVAEGMYLYFVELINTYGWDDYDSVFTLYIEQLIKVREEIFEDKYFTDEIFFTAFESNVATSSEHLTGTEDVFDENTGVQLSFKTTGTYESVYGEDYKITTEVAKITEKDLTEYKAGIDEEKFSQYGVEIDEISAVQLIDVNVLVNGENVETVNITVVEIGMSWYVDNTVTDTSVLYSFYK